MREDDSFTARAQEMQNAALLTAGFFCDCVHRAWNVGIKFPEVFATKV